MGNAARRGGRRGRAAEPRWPWRLSSRSPNGRVDLEGGTYVFVEPATDYVDDNLVLVQDGFVTDVWISDADRENEYYGYTPTTPADAARFGDDGSDGDQKR